MFPPNASELAMLDGVYPELTSKLPDAVPNTMTLALGALGTMAAIGKTALPVALVVPFMKYIAKSVKRASPQEENPHDASPSDIIPPEDLPLEPLYTNIIDHGLDFGGPHLKTLKSVPKVIIIGAGCAGLSAAFELKRAGANVVLLESSERVGGRVKTYGPGTFAAGLHCEGGAMRIPANNYMTLRYFKLFGIEDKLEKFEQACQDP